MIRNSKHMGLAVAGLIVIASGLVWAGGRFAMLGAPTGDAVPRIAGAPSEPPPAGAEQATFGGGCFWSMQAMFQRLKGVHSVVSGYSGGSVAHPSYEQVCGGATGHAEVVQITFDPAVISFQELLDVFWQAHNPTTRDRQGADVGPQYRSVIFYHTPKQKELAELNKRKLDAAKVLHAPIVTDIVPFSRFYRAEEYHQDYYVNNPRQPYCVSVIRPKLAKFEREFGEKLKTPSPK